MQSFYFPRLYFVNFLLQLGRRTDSNGLGVSLYTFHILFLLLFYHKFIVIPSTFSLRKIFVSEKLFKFFFLCRTDEKYFLRRNFLLVKYFCKMLTAAILWNFIQFCDDLELKKINFWCIICLINCSLLEVWSAVVYQNDLMKKWMNL